MTALTSAFRAQAASCTAMGSPFMDRLCQTLAAHWPSDTSLAAKCDGFTGALGPMGASLPLRVAGGLHALVLRGDPDLAAIYPPNQPNDADFRVGLMQALRAHDDFLTDWIDSPPQTNEIRRSAALIAGAHAAVSHFDRPIHLSELGASGGLNLYWDHYALLVGDARFGPTGAPVTLTPDWTGPLPPKTHPQITSRGGVDLTPLNPRDTNDLLRMQAFLWPDQPFRLEMTRAAAKLATVTVDQGDAIDWLDERLATAPKHHLHLIQNTVAWQYFPASAQARGIALIEAAGARATSDTPLGWLQLETDGDETGQIGAALTLRLWPGDLTVHLGRADFHGRWINWTGL